MGITSVAFSAQTAHQTKSLPETMGGNGDRPSVRCGQDLSVFDSSRAELSSTPQRLSLLQVVFILVIFCMGYLLGRLRTSRRSGLEMRSVGSQAPCTYTWWTQNPRFKPLADAAHG